MEKALERIIRETGRMPIECKCRLCQMQCKRAPCLGTPQDILALIKAGYREQLVFTVWMPAMVLGRLPFPIPMVQPRKTYGGCIFFEDGLCILHEAGLKPTEGRLSYHVLSEENFFFSKSLPWNVAREWINPENIDVIVRVLQSLDR